VQRLLELLGIPYTGTGPHDCEIAFDKVLAKDALRRAGVSTPAWAVVEDRALRDLGAGVGARRRRRPEWALPCVVKPSRSGSAMGVGFVERASDLRPPSWPALSSAAPQWSRRRSRVGGGDRPGRDPVGGAPLVEIVPKGGVYDYAARYTGRCHRNTSRRPA
jgi:D-alanine-D-alanine ligase